MQKNGKCYRVQTHGTMTPYNTFKRDSIFVKAGETPYDVHGLLLGPNSPLKNIPLLGWIF